MATGAIPAMFAVVLLLAPAVGAQDTYRTVTLAEVATTPRTHVCTVGPVVYVRKQADGDIHVTLADGPAKVVAEIIPQIPLPAPRKGQRIKVCGVTRIDKWHRTAQYPAGWPELHPVTSYTVVE